LTDAITEDSSRSGPHGVVAKVLHWGTAGLLLFAYIDNGDVTNALRDPASMRFEAVVGLGVVAAFAARFVWMQRWNGGSTRLPASAPWWEHRLSRLAHHSLYLCVSAIVASGLLIWGAQSFGGGGLVRAAADLHEFITGATLFVIGGHVAAALWHKIVRRDGVWESIGTPAGWPSLGWLRRVRG
jgi:cytochrome b561